MQRSTLAPWRHSYKQGVCHLSRETRKWRQIFLSPCLRLSFCLCLLVPPSLLSLSLCLSVPLFSSVFCLLCILFLLFCFLLLSLSPRNCEYWICVIHCFPSTCVHLPLSSAGEGSLPSKPTAMSLDWSETGSSQTQGGGSPLQEVQSSASTLTFAADMEADSHVESDSDDTTLSEAPPLIQRRSTLCLGKPAKNQQPLRDWLTPGYDVYVITLQEVTSKGSHTRRSSTKGNFLSFSFHFLLPLHTGCSSSPCPSACRQTDRSEKEQRAFLLT